MPVDVGAELAQEQHRERGRRDPVDVVVAVHADAPALGDRGADPLAGDAACRRAGTGRAAAARPSRKARASAGSVYPRRTRTLAVSSLIPSASASSACTRCGHGPIVQVPSCIVQPRYGGRRTARIRETRAVREEFLLDPEVVFLNHGSFGACPRPVFERYQAWQRELEREPVDFIMRRLRRPARGGPRPSLGAYVGAEPDDLTFVQNATTGVNMAARVARPPAGRRGARDRARVRRLRSRVGGDLRADRRALRRAETPLPSATSSSSSSRAQTERTRVVYASHITSATGAAPAGRGDRAPRTRGRPRRRSSTARTHPAQVAARPRRARRGLLCGELPQMAVRAEGRRLPARATRAAGARRGADRQLGPRRAVDLRLADGAAGHARRGGVPQRARGDRVPGGAQLGRRARALRRARARGAPRAVRAPRHRADRAGGDGAADGERAASRAARTASRSRAASGTSTASRSR